MAVEAPTILMVVHLLGAPGPAIDWVKPDECRNAQEMISLGAALSFVDDGEQFDVIDIECNFNTPVYLK